jgi:hypothetical protein
MRAKIAVGWVFAAALAPGIAGAERILLIPLDSRPAAGHFAQMIGAMADVTVEMPPLDLLGRFTTPGQPERLLEWLQNQDYGDVTAVILSTDMIAYGGLIASRTDQTSIEQATQRIRALVELRRTKPGVRFYGFSAITRLTPTATKATAGWRLQLGRYAEIKERYRRTPTPALLQSMRNLLAKIPPLEIQRYDAVRDRNHELQKLLLRFTAQGIFDYMVFGQDDAQPFGPHIPETQRLRSLTNQLSVPGRVYFCEGIDQHANVLLSRALLRARNWLPRIRVVFSDEAGRKRIADYESKTVDESLRDQLFASGARPTVANQEYDYSLYLNVPKRAETPFTNFLEDLTNEIDQGFPVGVADINIAKDGTADSELFDALDQNRRLVRLLSYAGWNTAGNTMGTSIPAANVYLLARRTQTTALRRELALREFLLHRIVNDFAYHRFVRPQAYRIIDSNPKATREETYGPAFDEVNDFVRGELSRYIADTFRGQFMGQRFFAGSKQYEITALEDLRVSLPWPRAYEVRIEFKMQASEVTSIGNVSIRWPSQAVEHVLRVARRSVTDLAADWVVERP